jgi:hypothetical protein
MEAAGPGKGSSLFDSTSKIAGQQAARKSGTWRQRILAVLRERPSTLWEVAQHFKVPDHTISGRFTELAADLWIERTGERRNHPVSNCPADVWRVSGSAPDPAKAAHLDKLGYPVTVRLGPDLHDRQELLPQESYPGIPYSRRADAGGVRQAVRLALIECPGCGRPLYMVEDRDRHQGNKLYRCASPTCSYTWRLQLAQEPGRAQVLALVLERH